MSTLSSHSIRIVLAAAVLLALAGCGNKGPLVMPQKPVPVEVTPAAAPEATPPASADPAAPSTPADGQSSQPTNLSGPSVDGKG
ncbi:lipoprotein [Xanthomonas sp. MUS 060]|uniref:LPS translocon maturation chaperone LptM n=1 Tax=Xanthomonas sp. MUS 060 TaxID=1588031 RepID=UPI0005F2924E|nr:lipoprotein [Xanthomonas sp. MUS 060]